MRAPARVVYAGESKYDTTCLRFPAVTGGRLAGGRRAAIISAIYAGVTGTSQVTVTTATLSSISVAPASATISVSGTQAFTATGNFSDGSTLAISSYVTWLSSNTSVAVISNAEDGSRGQAKGLATGSATISAVRGSVQGDAALTVQ